MNEQERKAWQKVKEAIEAIPNTDATTTEHFWDCECEHDFINSKEVFNCEECGIYEPEVLNQPDSRLREVILMLIDQAIQ